MKIIVIGYSKMFAAIIDSVLNSKHELVGVVRHDRIKYNPFKLFFKDIINPSNDISLIKSKKLNEIKVRSINSAAFKAKLIKLEPDIMFVCSWSEKIKKEIYSIPKIGTINVHPSLLPKYRGPNPYARVLFNCEKTTGVTFHFVDENYDTGSILMQRKFQILESDDGESLRNKAASVASIMCSSLLENTDESIVTTDYQDEKRATYYPALTLKDTILDFSQSSEKISGKIRGLYPWAKAYIDCGKNFLQVKKYTITVNNTNALPRTIIYKKGRNISIVTVDNKIITFFDTKLVKTIFAPSTRLFIKFGLGDRI